MRCTIFALLFLAGILVPAATGLAAESTAGSAAAGTVARTIETYQVGRDVYVRALTVDADRNSLWIGTSVGVLEVGLDSKQVNNTFTRDDGLANEYVFAVGVGPDSRVWFGTNAGGVSTLHNDKWKTYFPMHGLADYWVYAFAFDDDQDVWIGTWDGASHFDTETGRFTNYRDELINIWVYGIDIDSKGRVWFGTEGGVSMYDGGGWKSWTHDDGLGAPNLKDLPASANNGLGTRSRHDLNVLADGSATYNPNYVFSVHVDQRDEAIWFGTWGGGVSRLDPETGKWTSYTVDDGLAGNIVYGIAQEPNGTLWFATDRGVSRWDGKDWVNYTRQDGLIGDHTYAIAISEGPVIWLGSRGGVSRLDYGAPRESK